MRKYLGQGVSVILHTLAIIAVVLAFWPIGKWYFESKPLWGVDFYYTVTLTQLLKENLGFPASVWNHIWFAGSPFLSNFPFLHYYFILPFTFFWDIISSVKLWMLASSILFFIGSYAVFWRLSKNFILSLVIAIAGVYSVGVYGALTWGGSLPSYATQAAFPWSLYFALKHLQTEHKRVFLMLCLVTGLAILAHTQTVIVYIYPAVAILYFFWFRKKRKFSTRIKYFFTYLAISFLIGLPLTYKNLEASKSFLVTNAYKVASSTARAPTDLADAGIAFNRAQPLRILTDTHPLLFLLLAIVLAVFLIGLFFRQVRSRLRSVLPVFLIALWFSFYIWIFSYGISIYHGGWYRLFWSVPIYTGMLISALWGSIRRTHWLIKTNLNIFILIIASLFFFRPTILHELTRPDILARLVKPDTFGENYFREVRGELIAPGTISLISARSEPSSAFPDVVSLKIDPSDKDELKRELVPPWLEADSSDFRLYEADQTLNIWWNSYFKMPLLRGYLDPPLASTRGYTFWVDASLNVDTDDGSHQLAGSFGYPEDIAVNNTLFLIDWYAIKYFEAGHAGPTSYSPLPEFLLEEKYLKNSQKLDFNEARFRKGNEELNYFEIKDEFVSPILMGTNTPTLGIIASDAGYETIIRTMADMNMLISRVIPIKLGQYIDQIPSGDLSNIDSLLIYDYKYKNKNKAFGILSKDADKAKKK